MKKKIIKFIPFILIFIIVLTVIIALNINKTYTAGITKDEVKAMPENTLLAEIMGDNGPVRFDVKDANAELTLFDDFSKQETYNVEIALKYSNEDLVKTAKVMLKEGILFADTETLELENLESVTTDEKNPNTGTNIYKFNNATETIIFNILIKPNIIGKIEDAITIELYNDDTLKDSKNIDLNIKAENEDTTQDSLPNNNINNYETPSVDEPAAIDETGPFTYDLGISSLSYEDPLHPAPITEITSGKTKTPYRYSPSFSANFTDGIKRYIKGVNLKVSYNRTIDQTNSSLSTMTYNSKDNTLTGSCTSGAGFADTSSLTCFNVLSSDLVFSDLDEHNGETLTATATAEYEVEENKLNITTDVLSACNNNSMTRSSSSTDKDKFLVCNILSDYVSRGGNLVKTENEWFLPHISGASTYLGNVTYSDMNWEIVSINPKTGEMVFKAVGVKEAPTTTIDASYSFENSPEDKYLNGEFLETLTDPEKYLITDYAWNNSISNSDGSTVVTSSTIKRTVGLLNSYQALNYKAGYIGILLNKMQDTDGKSYQWIKETTLKHPTATSSVKPMISAIVPTIVLKPYLKIKSGVGESASPYVLAEPYDGIVATKTATLEQNINLQGGKVTAYRYLFDDDGPTTTNLKAKETKTGLVGESYEFSDRTLKGYELATDYLPNNNVGTFTSDDIDVIFYYRRKTLPVTINVTVDEKWASQGTTTFLFKLTGTANNSTEEKTYYKIISINNTNPALLNASAVINNVPAGKYQISLISTNNKYTTSSSVKSVVLTDTEVSVDFAFTKQKTSDLLYSTLVTRSIKSLNESIDLTTYNCDSLSEQVANRLSCAILTNNWGSVSSKITVDKTDSNEWFVNGASIQVSVCTSWIGGVCRTTSPESYRVVAIFPKTGEMLIINDASSYETKFESQDKLIDYLQSLTHTSSGVENYFVIDHLWNASTVNDATVDPKVGNNKLFKSAVGLLNTYEASKVRIPYGYLTLLLNSNAEGKIYQAEGLTSKNSLSLYSSNTNTSLRFAYVLKPNVQVSAGNGYTDSYQLK